MLNYNLFTKTAILTFWTFGINSVCLMIAPAFLEDKKKIGIYSTICACLYILYTYHTYL